MELWELSGGAGVTEDTENIEADGGSGTDPAALMLGLGAASRGKADAFLDDQRRLIADQRHHMHEQMRQMGLKLWELRLGVLLRISTAFVGITAAGALGWFVWSAANSNDLVIDSFQVPPDLAMRGLSGTVIAAKLSDRIATMQAQTSSNRPARSYANGLADNLKLEIPETGVSLSELDRFLRDKLAHDVHIGGEMVETGNGIALTARVGNDSATVTGTQTDVDGLLQKLAEQIYRTTQPYRYGAWLQNQGRQEESVAIFKATTTNGPASERAWAYNGWGVNITISKSERAGLVLLQHGSALDRDNYLLVSNIAGSEFRLGHTEASLRGRRAALALLAAHGRDYAVPDRLAAALHNNRALALGIQGALLESLDEFRAGEAATSVGVTFASRSNIAESLAVLHEPTAARAALAERPPSNGLVGLPVTLPEIAIAREEHDWSRIIEERDFEALTAQFRGLAEDRSTMAEPSVSIALAHLRRFAEAEARLKPMPSDCQPCLRARAAVATLEGQQARADYWFARAAAHAPSSPYAETEWGRALLYRDKPDDAIAQFVLANRKGPHFADPLEGWGEALMAKNQSHLALAKFAEAGKYAPNWGRLHLKWGEALTYAGKKDEAAKQFVRAAQLDLTPSEKAELARHP